MDAALWRDLFHPDVSILEKIIRPIRTLFKMRLSAMITP